MPLQAGREQLGDNDIDRHTRSGRSPSTSFDEYTTLATARQHKFTVDLPPAWPFRLAHHDLPQSWRAEQGSIAARHLTTLSRGRHTRKRIYILDGGSRYWATTHHAASQQHTEGGRDQLHEHHWCHGKGRPEGTSGNGTWDALYIQRGGHEADCIVCRVAVYSTVGRARSQGSSPRNCCDEKP